jgi:uncharacterized protein YndB with AHSA1/START domain
MSRDRIERTVFVAAPLERVWAVVTRAEHIAGWFSDTAEVDLRPGGALTLGWKEYGTYACTVERVEPPARVPGRLAAVFAWRGPVHPDTPVGPANSTLVEFTLTAEGEGTRLTVVESGFTALDMSEAEQDHHREDNTDGWRIKTEELRAYAVAG